MGPVFSCRREDGEQLEGKAAGIGVWWGKILSNTGGSYYRPNGPPRTGLWALGLLAPGGEHQSIHGLLARGVSLFSCTAKTAKTVKRAPPLKPLRARTAKTAKKALHH